MSNRELAKSLIDQVPESKLLYVLAYLQGVTVPDEAPMEGPDRGGGELCGEIVRNFYDAAHEL